MTSDSTPSPPGKEPQREPEPESPASPPEGSRPPAQPLELLPLQQEPLRTGRPGDRVIRVKRPRLPGVRRVSTGVYEIVTRPEPKTTAGRFWHWLRRVLIGIPIRTEHEIHERLTKIKALGVFASDNISSSAYATEEIMRVLVLAGTGALLLTLPLTWAIVALLAIVVMSYQQTIKAYPSGGGSYIVAMDNLGVLPGLVAGTAILIDYVLTVAVSISAGVAAVISAFPALHSERVLLCVAAIGMLAIGNLRGIRESGTLFSAPVYVYLAAILGLLGYGLFQAITGTLPPHTPLPHGYGGEAVGLFLLLRAFSSGAVALTGTEAISDGVPAFQPPESRNARITLIWMGTLFGSIFLGMSYLSTQLGIVPDPKEAETLVSQLASTLVGRGGYYYLVQFATAILLVLAANTSFADFPRLCSFMARDKFMPSQLSFRGERLAFNNGILMLAAFAGLLVILFRGSVTSLIPLYTVGVFIAFTLSQSGMVARWWRKREPGWRWSLPVNALGALATAVVAVVVGVTKFALGAWMVLVLIPLLVLLLLGIRRHYQHVADHIVVDLHNPEEHPDAIARTLHHYIVIPVSDLDLPTIQAIAYARSLVGLSDPDGTRRVVVQAVHVTDDLAAGQRLLEKWARLNCGVPLSLVESPYRALVGPLLRYLDAVERQHQDGVPVITVLLPEFVPVNWWEHFLHMQTTLWLKGALLFRPRTVVISAPHHLGSPSP